MPKLTARKSRRRRRKRKGAPPSEALAAGTAAPTDGNEAAEPVETEEAPADVADAAA